MFLVFLSPCILFLVGFNPSDFYNTILGGMCGLQVRIADDPVGIIAKKSILAMLKLYEDSVFFKVKYHDAKMLAKVEGLLIAESQV